jgi:hypothetical protein
MRHGLIAPRDEKGTVLEALIRLVQKNVHAVVDYE